jgi:hypothetical protein
MRRLTWVVFAAAAACTDSGSTIVPYAPDVFAANINTATGLITSSVFLSFAGLGPLIQVPGTSPTAPYFPDSLRGRTYIWNTGTHAYTLATQDTSPARGVRFILYDADSTGRPLEPTNQLGTATMQDGPSDTTALHVFAEGGVSQPTIAYLLSGSFHGDSFQAIADGCMYDAVRNLCVSAAVQQHVVSGDTAVTISGTASGTGVSFTFEFVFHFSAAGLADTVDVSALAPALQSQVIRMSGTTQFGTTTKADLSLTVNDEPFATVRGTGTLTVRRSNGEALSADEQALIGAMFSLPGELFDVCRALAHPGQKLLS